MVFYRLPSTQKALLKEVSSAKGLGTIWNLRPQDPSTVNALTTLPLQLPEKQELFKSVEKETGKSGLQLKLTQYYKYGKQYIKFYKTGVTNIWNNRKVLSKFKKNFMISTVANKNGNLDMIRIPNFDKLTKEMAQQLYMLEVQKQKLPNRGKNLLASSPFNITRAQYQLYNRTNKDFVKLPLFALVFAIFVEVTPLICYIFPEITPSTCALPIVLPKLWHSSSVQKLKKIRENEDLSEKALQTAYNLPISEVRILARSLRLTSLKIPIALYPESVLRRRLQNYYNYLVVDDYFILNEGAVWVLSPQELIQACLERNLIFDLKKDKKYLFQQDYQNELRKKLITWLMNFNHANIGYVGLIHSLPQTAGSVDLHPIPNSGVADSKN